MFTDLIPIPSSQFDFGGEATCPAGTVPWGGGAGFSGGFAGHGENINSSAPVGDSWRARYNNSGPNLNDHFAVEAICAKQPAGYTIAFSSADNPAHSQSSAVATCPTGTVLLSWRWRVDRRHGRRASVPAERCLADGLRTSSGW